MRVRRRSFADERGFANEGCAFSFVAAVLGLLAVLVLALLGRPVAWPIVIALVVAGVPGFLFAEGVSGLFWLSLLGLLACLAVGLSAGPVPHFVYYGLGLLALIGAAGVVSGFAERLEERRRSSRRGHQQDDET